MRRFLRRRWRLLLGVTAGVVVTTVGGLFGYMKLIEGAWVRYNKWDRRERGSLRVGDQAPDLELPLLAEGASVKLSELWRERPVFLVFGSCT